MASVKKATRKSAAKKAATKKAPAKRASTRRRATPAESANRVLNCLPSPAPERDWGVDQAAAAGTLDRSGPIPPSVDLRAPWWPVSDQGATGSCVGQSSADGVARWHFVNAGRLPQTLQLSIRYVWMAAKETDQYNDMPSTFLESDGTSLKAALDVVRKYGIVTTNELPFTGPLYPGDPKDFFAVAATRKIASYYRPRRGRLEGVAGRYRPDHRPPRRGSDLGQRHGHAGQPRHVHRTRTGWPRHHDRGLHGRPVHRAQQLGHGVG